MCENCVALYRVLHEIFGQDSKAADVIQSKVVGKMHPKVPVEIEVTD
jgi:hypothetical protein